MLQALQIMLFFSVGLYVQFAVEHHVYIFTLLICSLRAFLATYSTIHCCRADFPQKWSVMSFRFAIIMMKGNKELIFNIWTVILLSKVLKKLYTQ